MRRIVATGLILFLLAGNVFGQNVQESVTLETTTVNLEGSLLYP